MKRKNAKLVCFFLSLLLAMGNPISALAAWENPFTDVKSRDWFYDAVEYVNTEGLFNGTAPDKFSPEVAMSRGMFVTVLGKAAGIDTAAYSGSQFTDVPSDAYYAPYVSWAAQLEVVNGTSPTTFSPNSSITREQMATMLYKYAKAAGCDTSLDPSKLLSFPDYAAISDYAQQPMAWAVTHGVLAGSDGKLLPLGTATRAQTAQIFYNARQILASQTETPGQEKIWVVDVPGHYETVERLEMVEVIDKEEVGHWEELTRSHTIYICNTCEYEADTLEEIHKHLVESIVWTDQGATGCGGWHRGLSEPEPTGGMQWIVDVPAESHYELQIVKEEVWAEEVGHWEYR